MLILQKQQWDLQLHVVRMFSCVHLIMCLFCFLVTYGWNIPASPSIQDSGLEVPDMPPHPLLGGRINANRNVSNDSVLDFLTLDFK